MQEPAFRDLVSSAPAWRVRRAIRRGADLSARDEKGISALMLAARMNHHPGTIKALLAALYGNRAAVVAALIEAGALVRDTNERGETPLIQAARGAWSSGLIERLVEFGADQKVMDPEGKTALEDAVMPEVRSALQMK